MAKKKSPKDWQDRAEQLDVKLSQIGDLYDELAKELLDRTIQRIIERKDGDYNLEEHPYIWQLKKLNETNMLYKENIDLILEQTGIAKELFYQICENEGLGIYNDTLEEFNYRPRKEIRDINSTQDSLRALIDQSYSGIQNVINESLISANIAQNVMLKTYRDIITKATAERITGISTANQALDKYIKQAISQGMPVLIDKAGKKWSIDVYSRMVMQTTSYRVFNEMRTKGAKERGINVFYMSSHPKARPACAYIQGGLVTYEKEEIETRQGRVKSLYNYGYGEPAGTLGINCRHVLTPFDPDVNELPDEPRYKPEDAIHNYKLEQKQRSLERGIRRTKHKLEHAKNNNDKELAQKYNKAIQLKQKRIRELINDNKGILTRDYSREKYYGSSLPSYKTIKGDNNKTKYHSKINHNLDENPNLYSGQDNKGMLFKIKELEDYNKRINDAPNVVRDFIAMNAKYIQFGKPEWYHFIDDNELYYQPIEKRLRKDKNIFGYMHLGNMQIVKNDRASIYHELGHLLNDVSQLSKTKAYAKLNRAVKADVNELIKDFDFNKAIKELKANKVEKDLIREHLGDKLTEHIFGKSVTNEEKIDFYNGVHENYISPIMDIVESQIQNKSKYGISMTFGHEYQDKGYWKIPGKTGDELVANLTGIHVMQGEHLIQLNKYLPHASELYLEMLEEEIKKQENKQNNK